MEIKKYDEVWTVDGEYIGEAISLHYRPSDDVNPNLKLYATYLEVWSVLLGGHCYIPTDFIEGHDTGKGRVNLAVKMATVKHETWDRAPDFIAGHHSLRQELPMGQKTAVV